MFSDSQFAATYSQKEAKSIYIVQFGFAPFVKDELITDIQKLHTPLNSTKLQIPK